MFEEVKCKACKTILPSASYHRTSGEKSCKENLTSSLPRYLRWDYVPVTMGNHTRKGNLHDIKNDSIHVLIFRRPLQEMGWWRWKLYMKQIQRLATPCLYRWIFYWLLKWKTHLVFFIRANWRKMGTDWTSWGQIYGDIRCDLKILVEWWKTDWFWPRDGLRKLRGELPGVLRALWAAAAMATAAVRGDLLCQMRSRAWAGEVPLSLFWIVSWFVFFQVCLWLKCES